MELSFSVHIVSRATENEAEVNGDEGRLESHEARIERVVNVALEGCGLLSLVDAKPNHVVVVIENGVEIAQEDSTEPILVLHAHQFLNTNRAPLLILVHLVSVAVRPQLNLRLLKFEANRLHLLGRNIARLVSLHRDGAVEIFELIEADLIACLAIHKFCEHIVKDGAR